ELIDDYEHHDVLRIVLARAARSARRTTHFDLDFPREPQVQPYWCHKHKRTCRPVETASQFLRRYALDTLERLKAFSRVRTRGRSATVIRADSRIDGYSRRFEGIATSTPYPSITDCTVQCRYATWDPRHDNRRES